MGVENDSAPLVNPEVLLDERAVLGRQQAVREADEAVRRGHGGGGGGGDGGFLGKSEAR